MPKQSIGISGIGVTFIAMGIYLVYIGIKDIRFTEGLKEIFQEKKLPEGGKPKTLVKEPEPLELDRISLGETNLGL